MYTYTYVYITYIPLYIYIYMCVYIYIHIYMYVLFTVISHIYERESDISQGSQGDYREKEEKA